MSAASLDSRAIIGMLRRELDVDNGASWIGPLSMEFNSNQSVEEYKWLGMAPPMREWIGGRHAKGFRENGIEIRNKHFEATLEVLIRELHRDKTGQIELRIRELAQRAQTHWASLLSTLILGGATTEGYDGQFFFDTDHEEGDSGVQSNSLAVDISELPVINEGTITNPSVEEFRLTAMQGVQQILSFLDDQTEPLNENARGFGIMVPISMLHTAVTAVQNQPVASVSETGFGGLESTGFKFDVFANPRLAAWTDSFAVFRTDGTYKPFIRQSEDGLKISAIAEGSELAFKEDKHQYGVSAWRNVGYAHWQSACLMTMV